MYKPDPRLPPDQQIIPTHAKRQQQAQWSEAGAIPTTYDREFSPLAVQTENELKQPAVSVQHCPVKERARCPPVAIDERMILDDATRISCCESEHGRLPVGQKILWPC